MVSLPMVQRPSVSQQWTRTPKDSTGPWASASEISAERSRDLSQEKLAARAGLHRTYVGKVERGEAATTVDSLAALCAAMDTTLSVFFESFNRPIGLRGPRRRRS